MSAGGAARPAGPDRSASCAVRRTIDGWDPRPALRQALDPAADREVLKGGRRVVVRIWGLGPRGEAVVVKRARLGLGERLRALLRGSPAEAHWRGARALAALGIATPEPLAVLEERGRGAASTVVCASVDAAEPLKQAWLGRDRAARRRLARSLAQLVAALHGGGLYVPDLRDANFLVRAGDAGDELFLVDLDRWRRPRLGVARRRRIANLVQLERTLGAYASLRDKATFLAAYRRALPGAAPSLRSLGRAVERARRRKDAQVARRRRGEGIRPDERCTVTATIICGDEIANIRGCLDSVAWCDEVVVVDSGSTDGTFAAAAARATRVVRRPWHGHRLQKQIALDLATRPWVLNVDADERIPPELRDEIEAVLAHDGAGYDGFEIPRLVHYLGRTWRRGGWYPDRKLRLLRRANARWGGIDPHERAEVSGRIGRLETPILHYTYDDVADHVATIDRFTTIAAEQRAGRPSAAALLLRPLVRFVRFYLWKRAFLEGFPGLFLAISAAVYTYLKYAKLDERAAAGAAAPASPAGETPAPRAPEQRAPEQPEQPAEAVP